MIKQDIFTKTSRLYLDFQQQIKKMYDLYKNKEEYNLNDLYKSFDVLLQVLLLYVSVSNDNVSDDELDFIKKLTIEEDILEEYNIQFEHKLTWENLNEVLITQAQFVKFIDDTYELFYFNISKLIMFLAAVDSYTKKDYCTYFRDTFKEMLNLFIKVDNNEAENNIDYIIDKVFLTKYKTLKSMFEIVIKKNS